MSSIVCIIPVTALLAPEKIGRYPEESASLPQFFFVPLIDNAVEMPVQINGKVKCVILIPVNISKEEILEIVKKDEKVASAIDGKTIVKEIVVPGKIINIVVK